MESVSGIANAITVTTTDTTATQERHTTLFEVVIGTRCPLLGSTVGSGRFQRHYNCEVLALREGHSGKDVYGTVLPAHDMGLGDVLLVLAAGDFKICHHRNNEFIMINGYDDAQDEELYEVHYLRVPLWFPAGTLLKGNSEKERDVKVFPVPRWYPYLIIPIFGAMVGSAIAGYDLVICALLAVIGIAALGLTTPSRAIAAIEVNVFIMVSFSFGLGAAMEQSGFAAFLGYQIRVANVTGLPLLYLLAVLSAFLGNIISDKAAVQVIIPIAIQIFKEQKLPALGGITLCLCICTQALCTPYGFATHLMVMGPGGYRPADFVRFGLALNLLSVAVLPLIAYGVYYA